MTEESTACSARAVLEEFNKSGVRVSWPRLADLLDVPPQMQDRIVRLHEYKLDPALLVKEEESLRQVLSYWENNDPNHTWEILSSALMSDPVYKDLGASLYFKHVKPEEFTLDKVYEEVKEITNPREIAYVLIQDSKKLREIWGGYGNKLTPDEECTKLAINHWMTTHPLASWMLLAKYIERYIHGEHEAAAQRIATTIREKYLPKVEEKMEFGPPKDSEKRKFPEKFGANEAFKELTAVEDWFGLGWFLEVEEEELKQIEEEHWRDDDRKLAMLKLWVELNPKSSWNSLTTAVRKMPQHQSLARDIQENFLEQERQRIIQKELNERSKELYDQFFQPLFESLCNEQVYSSLVHQLVSMSLISEADKETLLSSTQHPKVRATSLLEVLNIEEKPHLLMELIKAMEKVEKLKGLADEMLTQYKANEGGGDAVMKTERQLRGVHIVAEQVFKVQGGSAQSLLWEEHGFRMYIPQDALLPNEFCLVFVKAIVAGLFQFPKGTERVSAVYAISSTQQFHKPVTTELQHCVQLDNSEQGKYMSFAVAQLDLSSTHYKFQLSEGTFQPNSYFGTFEENQFLSLATCIVKYSSTIKCPSNSGRQHLEKSVGDEQVEEAEKLEGVRLREPESKRPKLDIATPVDTKDVSGHKSILPGPTVYNGMTFYQKQNLPYTWIVAVAKKYNTMEEHVKKYFKDAEFDMKMVFSFEKEGKENGGSLLLVMEPHITPSGWLIQPQIHPSMIHESDVVLTDGSPECHPMFQKVEVTIADWSNPPTTTLAQSVPMLGIKYPNVTSLSFMFESPTTTGQLTGVKVVDEKIFKVKGESAQPLLWEEHSFRMYIPQDALLHNETCFVTVKAIVGGLFQFPEGTEPVSAIYAISLSRQLHKPARLEMQHCVKLKNPEHNKFMSFAVASQDPSSMPYQFQEIPGGIFETNCYLGSVVRQQFSFVDIILRWIGIPTKPVEYSALTYKLRVLNGYEWILVVSHNVKTMKQYMRTFVKEAREEADITFIFEEESLTLEIEQKATPGWIIEPFSRPCIIMKNDVDKAVEYPKCFKLRIAVEQPNNPPNKGLRNNIRLDGIIPKYSIPVLFDPISVRRESDACSTTSHEMDYPPDQSSFLNKVISKIPTEWRRFGFALEIDTEYLDDIENSCKDTRTCFEKVFGNWKKDPKRPFTWETVLDVLKELKQPIVRESIKKDLLLSETNHL